MPGLVCDISQVGMCSGGTFRHDVGDAHIPWIGAWQIISAVCRLAVEVPDISDDCREEVFQFKIRRNTNINYNVPLGEHLGLGLGMLGLGYVALNVAALICSACCNHA